jgi:predicted dehydrogenase
MRIGVVGLGYWGPNLVRVLNQSTECTLAAVCDLDSSKLAKIARQYPGVRGFMSVQELLNSDIEAVVVATSIGTHYAVAKQALEADKHVFVEKPLCDSSLKAKGLVGLADERKVTLMTGHTFVYSPPVVRIKNLIDSAELGDVHYISCSRVNLGLYQKDVDVLWDLAVHDISILLYWLEESPVEAASFGRSCVQNANNDVAFVWFQFPSGVIASCEVSWLSPQKLRRTCVVGSKRMVAWDDTQQDEKIKIYDRGVNVTMPSTFGEFQLTYRTGDMISPQLANTEPLSVEMGHFVECCHSGATPKTDGRFGLRVVQAMEMAANHAWNTVSAVAAQAVGD